MRRFCILASLFVMALVGFVTVNDSAPFIDSDVTVAMPADSIVALWAAPASPTVALAVAVSQ